MANRNDKITLDSAPSDEPPIQINITAEAARVASRKAAQEADELYKKQLRDYLNKLKEDVQKAIQAATITGDRTTLFTLPACSHSLREADIRRESLRRLDDALKAQGFSTNPNAQLMTIKIDWQ